MARIKAKEGTVGVYHCMSRIVGGEFLLGDLEKEMFTQMMWRIAHFLGIRILGFNVMSNHYHQLVQTPATVKLTNPELLKRLKAYYGPDSLQVKRFCQAMQQGEAALNREREQYLSRMGDVSEFEKILKQGFSQWYNKRNGRRGTLWMERFKAVLVEDETEVLKIMALYIDLNPVRAQCVEDPAKYRFCGYAAAMAGYKDCQKGIQKVLGIGNWTEAAAEYRKALMQRGHAEVAGKQGTVSRALLLKTLEQGGTLTKMELLQLRVRYMSDGLVLGSELFVEEIFTQYRSHFGEKRKRGARPIRGLASNQLKVLRDLRLNAIS